MVQKHIKHKQILRTLKRDELRDGLDRAVAFAKATVHRRVGITGAIVVSEAGIINYDTRLPHHIGVLLKISCFILSFTSIAQSYP